MNTSKVYDGMQSRLLGLRARAVRSCGARGADGLAGRRALHHAQYGRAVPPVPESVPAAGSHRQSDLREEDSGDDPRLRFAGHVERQEPALHSIRHGVGQVLPVPRRRAFCPKSTRNTTSARTPTAARFRGSRPAALRRSTWPSIIPRNSAACTRWSAASRRLQWKPGELDGGNIYPFKVRREPKRNLRVWMSDGSEDQEAGPGSWPLQNIQLANSLKLKGYDFHFSFGGGTHHAALAVIGVARVPHLAVARLRSEEDRTDLRAERGGKGQAAVPRPHLQSLRR